MSTTCSHNVKTLYVSFQAWDYTDGSCSELPNGIRGANYIEFGVHRLFSIGDEDDDKLIVVRRASPHPTAGGHGLVSLGVLQNHQLCAVCKGIEALGPNCHFELVHLALSKVELNALTCTLCALLLSALKQPYSYNTPLASAPSSDMWGKFIRNNFAIISIASFPHSQKPDQETYFHVYLVHEGHDHSMCTFSIFKEPGEF
jgi:hypothetical protein